MSPGVLPGSRRCEDRARSVLSPAPMPAAQPPPRLPFVLGLALQQQSEVTNVSPHSGQEKGFEWAAVTHLETRGFQIRPISLWLTLNWAGPVGGTAAQSRASPGLGRSGRPEEASRIPSSWSAAGPAWGGGLSQGLLWAYSGPTVTRGLRSPGSGFTS